MDKTTDETKIAVLVEKVGNMNVTLSKLDGKLDTMTDKFALKTDVDPIKKDVEDLKGWKNKMLGALVIAQVVWGGVVYFLTSQK